MMEEQKRLEADIANLAAQKAMMEEQKRLEEEKTSLAKKAQEEERQKIAEEQEKTRLAAEKEADRQAMAEREKAKKDTVPAMVPPLSQSTTSEIARDGRFIAYDNGTVLDTRTNLMWAAKDNGSDINWPFAKSYCDNYRGGDYSDWRMPTQDELEGLYDVNKSRPVACNRNLNIHVATELINFSCFWVWASEERDTESATFYFNLGVRLWYRQGYDGDGRTLPVRSGK